MSSRNNGLKNLMWGALAGVAGGVVMTAMRMKVAPKVLPEEMQPEEFVPKEAVEWAEEKAGQPQALSEAQEMSVALVAHLGYSALMGSLYGIGRPQLKAVPAPLAGALFGLAVWGVSFEGWMPAVGIIERTTDKPPKKWTPYVMGHIVYGAVTALGYEGLEKLQKQLEPPQMSSITYERFRDVSSRSGPVHDYEHA